MRYEMAVELVRALRKMGIVIRVVCPRCGAEGTLSVLRQDGYTYLIVRHLDKSTHTVHRSQLDEVLSTLCRVKKDLEYILELYKKDVELCTDEKPGPRAEDANR
jgi:hypothetical protein